MQYDQPAFLVFFPVVVTLFFVTPGRWRMPLLLISSYFFYLHGQPWLFGLLLLYTTLIDYLVASRLMHTDARSERRLLVVFSLIGNFGLLFYFKYFNLAAGVMNFWAGDTVIALRDLVLPAGISFYTFQTVSYVIDVYRRQAPAEKNLLRMATFVTFFPQLVAGPIERPGNLIPQLGPWKPFDDVRIANGLRLMAWGFFKKLVIADRLSELVEPVYADPKSHPSLVALATLAFGYQIYCDFSGYTDIGIGAARVFGIKLMENFRVPYRSRSIREFWTRWHISLSTWFRDYVYLPLGGNRVSGARWTFNILVVFLLSGLWHGANWTFVAWGLYNGLLLVIEHWTTNLRSRLSGVLGLNRSPQLASMLALSMTFALIMLGWVFFRARSFADATAIFAAMPGSIVALTNPVRLETALEAVNWERGDSLIAVAALAVLGFAHTLQLQGSAGAWLSAKPLPVRWSIYYGLLLSILCFANFDGPPFIYFQF